MNGYPTSEASGAGADGAAAGWYGDQSTDESAQPEQVNITASTNRYSLSLIPSECVLL